MSIAAIAVIALVDRDALLFAWEKQKSSYEITQVIRERRSLRFILRSPLFRENARRRIERNRFSARVQEQVVNVDARARAFRRGGEYLPSERNQCESSAGERLTSLFDESLGARVSVTVEFILARFSDGLRACLRFHHRRGKILDICDYCTQRFLPVSNAYQ